MCSHANYHYIALSRQWKLQFNNPHEQNQKFVFLFSKCLLRRTHYLFNLSNFQLNNSTQQSNVYVNCSIFTSNQACFRGNKIRSISNERTKNMCVRIRTSSSKASETPGLRLDILTQGTHVNVISFYLSFRYFNERANSSHQAER